MVSKLLSISNFLSFSSSSSKVCCILPLAVSECPECPLIDVATSEKDEEGEESEEGPATANTGFEDDGINLDSLNSTAYIIKKSEVKRLNTIIFQVCG